MSILDPIELKITAVLVTPDKWVRGDYQPIGCLRYSAAELESRLKVHFFDYIEDGLGKARAVGFQLPSGRFFGLTQYLEAPAGFVAVEITWLNDERFATDLEDILESLDMDLSDMLIWDSKMAISDQVKLVAHALYRQDDFGLRTLIEVFPSRANASKRMRELEALGHKQTYWIAPQPATVDRK